MAGLRDREWRIYYPDTRERLSDFYIPALSVAKSYDRSAGYFTSRSLAIAAAGVSRLLRNEGTMRLLVGAQLTEEDVKAVEEGYDLRERIAAGLVAQLRDPADLVERDRLAALAWMVARNRLEVRVVLEADERGLPIPYRDGAPYYHSKLGVIADAAGDRIAFSGSVNESVSAWDRNCEDLLVHTSWDQPAYVNLIARTFEERWEGTAAGWVSVNLPEAARERLLRFSPEAPPGHDPLEREEAPAPPERSDQAERILFQFVRDVPRLAHARQLAAQTSAIRPWPHQLRVAQTVTERYPEGFLLCDEVGLGKTIEAGLILRQLFLDGRVRRAMILTPASVLKQFQEELYEKFVLDVPRYEGGVFKYRDDREEPPGTENPWNAHPLFLASSQLAKRRDRRPELLAAEPFDLVLVDEAHHARRREFQDLDSFRPNNLLGLLRELRDKGRAKCLILMTATPLQVHPIEVYDLLHVLGLGGRWGAHPSNFLGFFRELRKDGEDEIDWRFVVSMVRDAQEMGIELDGAFEALAQERLGPVEWRQARGLLEGSDPGATIARLTSVGKGIVREMVRRMTPLRVRIQRNTRELLRRYKEKGLLKGNICRRQADSIWIPFTREEEQLYDEVETYITDFYKKYEAQRRGLGFVMTVYRRRLTSSFHALEQSLVRRLEFLTGARKDAGLTDDDLEEEELAEDVSDTLFEERDTLHGDEIAFVRKFLRDLRALPQDSKFTRLHRDLDEVFRHRETVVVFTQYTDTMDYLRDRLREVYGRQIACYSGRGGEVWDGTAWRLVPKEDLKAMFRRQEVRILLGTEAMSEGLNLQTCGVLFNFDMPWNPMRVEQRIGRIDRIGQRHDVVWIRNYFYEKSVEAEVYRRLEDRIDWFETVVGALQPILTSVAKALRRLSMTDPKARPATVEQEVKSLEQQIEEREVTGLDLDKFVDAEAETVEAHPQPVSPERLQKLLLDAPAIRDRLRAHPEIERAFLMRTDGTEAAVTFDATVFDSHPDTLRLLTFGEPLLAALFERVPAPSPAEGGGRVLRCEAEDSGLVAYYGAGKEEPVLIKTLEGLGQALADKARLGTGSAESAAQDLEERVRTLRQRETDVRSQLAAGEYLARKEEARVLLRRAACVETALRRYRSGQLFETTNQPSFDAVAAGQPNVRDFARRLGHPFAPLLVALEREDIVVTPTDSFLATVRGDSEPTLVARERRLREQATELLGRLLEAKNRAAPPRNSVAIHVGSIAYG